VLAAEMCKTWAEIEETIDAQSFSNSFEGVHEVPPPVCIYGGDDVETNIDMLRPKSENVDSFWSVKTNISIFVTKN
jgi:hypothetical protein